MTGARAADVPAGDPLTGLPPTRWSNGHEAVRTSATAQGE
jgi:hypothetical protein